MNELNKPIVEVFEAYKAAVFTKNIDGFVALYDQDVGIFDMWVEWSYNGATAWRGMVSEWFASLGANRDQVDFEDVKISVTDDLAVAYAFVVFSAVSPEGKILRSMSNRLTWALAKKGGAWKIIHQHTSAPIDFQTMKVILKR